MQVTMDARWEGVVAQRAGTVADLSTSGCFILTSDLVDEAELIRLEIQTPRGDTFSLWGEVVYKLPEMGFALRFTGAGDAERKMLALLLEYARFNDATMAS